MGGIPPTEFEERRERLLEHVRRAGLTGYVLFGADYIQYFTGFWFLSNERPVAYAQTVGGDSSIFVPEFEAERTRAEAAFERIDTYSEYPGLEHPMRIFARVLADIGIENAIGADQDGYPGILGYEGPPLSEVTGASVEPLARVVESMMARKSENELELIRESGRWCAHAHRLLQAYTRPGVTEAEASLRAGQETTLAMLAAHGDVGGLSSSAGASAGYRGQIGKRSAWAHAVAHAIEFHAGDMLVTETSAPIWGYNAELERGMVIGPPTDEQRQLFGHVVAAQEAAFAAIRPGATCADVDGAVMRYFEENALLPYWRQHTGHGIGLATHELPTLGRTAPVDALLPSPTVFSVEPGVYLEGEMGVRIEDLVLFDRSAGRVERLTQFPREAMVVGA